MIPFVFVSCAQRAKPSRFYKTPEGQFQMLNISFHHKFFFFFFLQLGLKHKFGLFHKFVNKNQRKKMNLPFLKAQLECFIIINSKAISIHRGHLSKKYIPYILTDKQTNKQRMNLIHSLTMFLKQSLPSS